MPDLPAESVAGFCPHGEPYDDKDPCPDDPPRYADYERDRDGIWMYRLCARCNRDWAVPAVGTKPALHPEAYYCPNCYGFPTVCPNCLNSICEPWCSGSHPRLIDGGDNG